VVEFGSPGRFPTHNNPLAIWQVYDSRAGSAGVDSKGDLTVAMRSTPVPETLCLRAFNALPNVVRHVQVIAVQI
jgi:hypothetical protein